MKRFRMHSLLSPLYLVLPVSAAAWDRPTDIMAPKGNLTEVQEYAQIFGYNFVWQSNAGGGYGGGTSADYLSFAFPPPKKIKQCIRRCYAQSARLGSVVANEDSSLCSCNTDENCIEEEILYSGGVIFSISSKSETNLCSFQKGDPLLTPAPTTGFGTSYYPTSSGTTSQPSGYHLKTAYPTSSSTFTQTATLHTTQPTETKLENSTSSNLFYTKMTPSSSPKPTTSDVITTNTLKPTAMNMTPTLKPSTMDIIPTLKPTAMNIIPTLKPTAMDIIPTLKPTAMNIIPMSIMVRSDSATLSPSVTVSTPLTKTNSPTVQPTPIDSLSTLVGNYVEIPPFALQLSFKRSKISISEDQIGRALTFYMERYISSWLTNSTKAVEVDVHLDPADDTPQSRYRSLQVSAKSTQALQYEGGYAIIYSNAVEESSWLGSLDKCQLIDLLSVDISSSEQNFIWYIKGLSQRSLGTVDAYLSTLSQVVATPSPCITESESALPSNNSFRIFLIFLVGTLIAAVFLCGFLTVWYRKRGNRKSLPTSEAMPSEVIPSQSNDLMKWSTSQSNELMKWGTSQSTEVTTNVSRSNRKSIDHTVTRWNDSTATVNPNSGIAFKTNHDVEDFSQRFQVVRSGIRRNSQYISPTTSYEEDQTSLGSVSEDDDDNSYNWDDITRSLEDDWSNNLKDSLTTMPSYDVPSDEEKSDVRQKRSSTASWNSQRSVTNELEYHDVLDSFDMPIDIEKSISILRNYGNRGGIRDNGNSGTYTVGKGFLYFHD